MYKMGTGDCFAIKFLADKEEIFKIMIDAGTWQGSKDRLGDYIKDLKTYLGDYTDVLIVTHEHKDHVHAFDACEELFTDDNFHVGEIWMGWTENDRTRKVKEWKEDFGEKKKALGLVAKELETAMNTPDFKNQFAGNRDSEKMLGARNVFKGVLSGFADLHLSFDEVNKVYKGGQAGMEVVKKKIKKDAIKFFKPGDVIRDLGEAEGVKIYVLGPPELYEEVKKEAGGEGESYKHNKQLRESDAFGAAVLGMNNTSFVKDSLLPFDEHYMESTLNEQPDPKDEVAMTAKKNMDFVRGSYKSKDWRKIDYDWLFSAGSFALRMNGLTNNLSLALAFEFEEGGKVLLFPGDAEFGSWESWHRIKWKEKKDGSTKEKEKQKHLTEDLLNRTVFYKVAHHLSHNGTAQKLGLEMMNHDDLVAMATLDYEVINDGWTSTMPNRAIIKELLARTKGRLMIMNEKGLFFDFHDDVPLREKIDEARDNMTTKERAAFTKNFDDSNPLYLQYTVKL